MDKTPQQLDDEIAVNKRRFIELCDEIERDGIRKLLKWLVDSDFFIAPASTRYHGAYKGGLLKHSLNVYDELMRLLKAYPEIEASRENIIISSLFHDLCKVNFYGVEKRNRKNADGRWESYDAYNVSEKFCFGGHGSKSVFLVQQFIKLEPVEAVAINCHMGAWDGNTSVGNSYEKFPLAWLVHVADESATYMLEGED